MDKFCMDFLCEKVLDTEDERDSFVNLLGRTLMVLEKKLTEDLTAEEEIALYDLMEDGFAAIGDHFSKLEVEMTNDHVRSWRLGFAPM